MHVAQWTIDPRKVASGEVCDKAIVLFEARPRVIVRTSRRGFRVPSWTKRLEDLAPADRRDTYCKRCWTVHNGLWYHQVLTVAPDGWKCVCDCDSTGWCHHGYAAALELARLDHLTIPVPGQPKPASKRVRSRSLTVISGGKP